MSVTCQPLPLFSHSVFPLSSIQAFVKFEASQSPPSLNPYPPITWLFMLDFRQRKKWILHLFSAKWVMYVSCVYIWFWLFSLLINISIERLWIPTRMNECLEKKPKTVWSFLKYLKCPKCGPWANCSRWSNFMQPAACVLKWFTCLPTQIVPQVQIHI